MDSVTTDLVGHLATRVLAKDYGPGLPRCISPAAGIGQGDWFSLGGAVGVEQSKTEVGKFVP